MKEIEKMGFPDLSFCYFFYNDLAFPLTFNSVWPISNWNVSYYQNTSAKKNFKCNVFLYYFLWYISPEIVLFTLKIWTEMLTQAVQRKIRPGSALFYYIIKLFAYLNNKILFWLIHSNMPLGWTKLPHPLSREIVYSWLASQSSVPTGLYTNKKV